MMKRLSSARKLCCTAVPLLYYLREAVGSLVALYTPAAECMQIDVPSAAAGTCLFCGFRNQIRVYPHHQPNRKLQGRRTSFAPSLLGLSSGRMFLAPKDLTFLGSTLELTVPHATHLHAAKLAASRAEVLSIFVLAAALSALTRISSASAWWQLAVAAWGWLELIFYSIQLIRCVHPYTTANLSCALLHISIDLLS